VAAAIAAGAAIVQLAGLADGGVLGGSGSTFALLLALAIGFAGLGHAWRLERTAA